MSNPDIASRFDEIYDSTNKEVLAFIMAKCSRTSDIRDIFQESYMELYQVLCKRGVTYITNERALIFRLTKQKIARHYSLSERLRMFIPMTVKNEDGEDFELSDFETYTSSTEDIAVDQVMLDTARKLIRQKSEDVKKVFYLFYEADQTIPAIAQALSMSESNVQHKLYRTLQELRTLLK